MSYLPTGQASVPHHYHVDVAQCRVPWGSTKQESGARCVTASRLYRYLKGAPFFFTDPLTKLESAVKGMHNASVDR